MNHTYNKIKSGLKSAACVCAVALFGGAGMLTSCTETDSSLVEYAEDNRLCNPSDTVYSLVGIIGKMQHIADRTVLLGELRGELTALTSDAQLDLQDIANFNVKDGNQYDSPADYYAIIQNCNYYLAKADTTLSKRGEKIFAREYAVVRTYRAWTYLQLALNYGQVPFFTEPILAEKDANPALYPHYDVKQIAEYFIKDLEPYVDTKYPQYGAMGGMSSERFYYPVRVLLGDLCLWAERYREAAAYYHDYLTKTGDIHPIGTNKVGWSNYEFEGISDSYASSVGAQGITVIPMANSEYDGLISYVRDVFSSTEENNYYYQATRSKNYDELSAAQQFCLVYRNTTTQVEDTIYPPETKVYEDEAMRGDLRLNSVYTLRSVGTSSSTLSSLRQTHYKYTSSSYVRLLRIDHVYLRYAEALNRAGIPEAAFAVLKHGLCEDNLVKSIGGKTVDMLSATTREKAGDLIAFSQYTFTSANTIGIHSRGSGRADADKTYEIPELETLEDSILFVEDKICDEMALETAGEGLRFYDLMRIAQHRNDPAFLAAKVATRNGSAKFDNTLYAKLSDKKNWYLQLPQ